MSWTAQAEVMADTTDLGCEAAMMCGRCRATGLDVRSFAYLIGATLALGVRPLTGKGWTPYPDDHQLVEDLIELAGKVYTHLNAATKLINTAAQVRAHAAAMFGEAASADPPRENDMAYWAAVMGDCGTALEVLAPVPPRLGAAAVRLTATPAQLGDAYAAVYQLLAAGRVMPHDGRWITGEEMPCSST